MISVKPHEDGYIVKIDGPDEEVLFMFIALLLHISNDDDYDRLFTKALRLLKNGQVEAEGREIEEDEEEETEEWMA